MAWQMMIAPLALALLASPLAQAEGCRFCACGTAADGHRACQCTEYRPLLCQTDLDGLDGAGHLRDVVVYRQPDPADALPTGFPPPPPRYRLAGGD